MNRDQIADYRRRCLSHAADLREMADQADLDGVPSQGQRLSGKAQGLDLALEYLRDYPDSDALDDVREKAGELIKALETYPTGANCAKAQGIRALLLALDD